MKLKKLKPLLDVGDFPRVSKDTIKKKQKSRKPSVENKTGDLFKGPPPSSKNIERSTLSKHIFALYYEHITDGMRFLGCVTKVTKLYVHVSLPFTLSGVLSVTEVSDAISNLIESDAFSSGGDSFKLEELIPLGTCLPCTVVSVSKKTIKSVKTQTTVNLSTKPSLLNVIADHIPKGTVLWCCVSSLEDHGYLLEAIAGVSTFLNYNDCKSKTKKDLFRIGHMLACVTKKEWSSGGNKLIEVILATKLTLPGKEAVKLPGTFINATITKKSSNGCVVHLGKQPPMPVKSKVPRCTSGIIHALHYPQHGRTGSPCVGDTHVSVVLAHCGKYTWVSLAHTKYLIGRRLIGRQSAVGSEVTGSVVQDLPYPNFALFSINQKWPGYLPGGSTETLRDRGLLADMTYSIESVNLIDQLFKLMIHKKDYFKGTDNKAIKPGMIVPGLIKLITPQYVLVELNPSLMSICPSYLWTDAERSPGESYPGQLGDRVSCRVVEVNESAVVVTTKESMFLDGVLVMDSVDGIAVGTVCHGVIASMSATSGTIVKFFNGVMGMIPERETLKATDMYVGKTVKVVVTKVYQEENKLLLGLFKATPKTSTRVQFRALNSEDVGRIVKMKVTDKTDASFTGHTLGKSAEKLLLPRNHVSDFSDVIETSMRVLHKSHVFKHVVIISRTDDHFVVSNKESLVEEAKNDNICRLFSDFHEGLFTVGYVKDVVPFGCFVELPGRFVGLLPKKAIKGCSLTPGMTVCCTVTLTDPERQRLLLRLCRPPSGSYLPEYLKTKSVLAFKVANLLKGEKSASKEFYKLKLGQFDNYVCVTASGCGFFESQRTPPPLKAASADRTGVSEDGEQPYQFHRGVGRIVMSVSDGDSDGDAALPEVQHSGRVIWCNDYYGLVYIPEHRRLVSVARLPFLGKPPLFFTGDIVEVLSDGSGVNVLDYSVLEKPLTKDVRPFKVGSVVGVVIKKTSPVVSFAYITDSEGVKHEGTIHCSQVTDEMKDWAVPMAALRVGQQVQAKVIGYEKFFNRSSLAISHAHKFHLRPVLSLKPSIIEDQDNVEPLVETYMDIVKTRAKLLSRLEIGDQVVCYVLSSDWRGLRVSIDNVILGRVMPFFKGIKPRQLGQKSIFKPGMQFSAIVTGINAVNQNLFLSLDRENPKQNSSPGCLVNGQVTKCDFDRGCLEVKLAWDAGTVSTGRISFWNIADKYSEQMLDDQVYSQSGGFLRCRVIARNPAEHRLADLSSRYSAVYGKQNVVDRLIDEKNQLTKGQSVKGFVEEITDSDVIVRLSSKVHIPVPFTNISPCIDSRKSAENLLSPWQMVVMTIGSDCSGSFDLPTFCPGGSRDWKKRKMHPEDVQGAKRIKTCKSSSEKEPMGKPVLEDKLGFLWTLPEVERESVAALPDDGALDAPEADLDENDVDKLETSLLADPTPLTVDGFEKLVLASPASSVVWLRYMAFYIENMQIESARKIAERALVVIPYREEGEKWNIWAALLNMETAYGAEDTLYTTFRRACSANDSMKVYLHLAATLNRSERRDEADKIYNQALKKYGNSSKEIWGHYARFLATSDRLDAMRRLLTRCLSIVERRLHVDIIVMISQLEFKHGDPARGITSLGNVLETYPRRTDIWLVYLDHLVKTDEVDTARRAYEKLVGYSSIHRVTATARVTSLNLSAHKMKGFFKAYLDFESIHGDAKSVEMVKERAVKYVEGKRKTP